jgi:hypothetical protein
VVGVAGSVGYRWTASDGIVGLGDFWPAATSADGSVLAGVNRNPRDDLEAWISHPQIGNRFVADLLERKYGLDLAGYRLTQVTGISDDGLTLAGTALGPNGTEAWIATLDLPEPSSGLLLGFGLLIALRRRR